MLRQFETSWSFIRPFRSPGHVCVSVKPPDTSGRSLADTHGQSNIASEARLTCARHNRLDDAPWDKHGNRLEKEIGYRFVKECKLWAVVEQ